MQIRAELAHSRLRGSDWLPWTRQNGGYRNEQGNNSFEFINPVTGVPFVGDAPKLYLAERDRNRFQAFVSYQATSDLLITPRVQWVKDDYIDSETGLQDFERRLLGIDASYLANERTTLYAWVGLEQFDADQTGGQLTAGNGNPIAPNNNQARWFVNREDTVQSIGFGGEYEHIPGKLTYGSEISYVKTSGEASSRQPGVFVGTESLPDIETTWTQFSLFANYVVAKNLDLNVRYLMERYEEKDYGHDWDFDRRPAGAAGGPYTLLGIDSPDYTAHLVAATVRYRF